MLAILSNRTYRHLFAAQVIALVGTGLLTVALGLLAFELAGAEAGAVLGTALAIKMIAYVGVAPVASPMQRCVPWTKSSGGPRTAESRSPKRCPSLSHLYRLFPAANQKPRHKVREPAKMATRTAS